MWTPKFKKSRAAGLRAAQELPREDLGAIASPSPSDLRAEQRSSRCCAGSAEQAPRKHPPRGLASRSAAPYAAR